MSFEPSFRNAIGRFVCFLIGASLMAGVAGGQNLGTAPELSSTKQEDAIIRATSVDVPPIDTADRSAVVAAFYTSYNASEGFTDGWDGNTTSCVLGVNSQNFTEATLRRVNYFRAMAGLPGNVVLDDAISTKCRRAAMMMSAEGQLSNNPTNTWSCYTIDGYDGAHNSNIALGIEGPAAINLYLDDPGTGNEFVGHRRWILFPPQAVMGTGSVPSQNGKMAANALWVLASFGSRPAAPEFVAWPAPGFFPYQLLPKSSSRWSFSRPTASLGIADVTVTKNGTPLTVNIVSRSENGVGDNTLVWTVSGVPTSAPATDTSYVVTVSDVLLNGAPTSYTYTVTVIDPAVPNLKARFATDQVTIAWPVGPSGFLLQTGVVNGASVTWGDAGLESLPVSDEHQVKFAPEPGVQLFRLRK